MRDQSESRLVLWDIDHTLIRAGGVGVDSCAAAFTRATGRAWNTEYSFSSLTDAAMAADLLRFHGIAADRRLVATFHSYLVDEHRARAADLAIRGQALPGAVDVLAALDAAAGVRQSVLTGNLRPIADLKLAVFGLGRWLDLAIGAFGDEETERSALVPRALRQAREQRGERYHPAQTVLVGDTVRDVEAALVNGAAVVAVATGTTSAARLRAAGADIVLDDLADTERVLDAVNEAAAAAAAR
ncbi:haloacid dehalogenase [Phytohabitans suffuscus]|uniref:Haloacid dehalogenase n=1 Tax=Phytohabitans suffuscus TaxID=624315 RepID=A0A6F8YS46_9ACTN|nr:haloacid dehalogenase [Phytohabitans suffuscus]